LGFDEGAIEIEDYCLDIFRLDSQVNISLR
jgi:hypothetical protein